MKNYLDCVPCFFKQCIETARMAGAADDQIKRIIDYVGFRLKEIKLNAKNPEISLFLQDIIKQELENTDPYKKIKEKTNFWALSLYPHLKKIVKKSKDSLLTAVKIAIVGNYFDTVPHMNPNLFNKIDIILRGKMENINQANPFLFQYQDFKKKLKEVSSIVYIGDNAGELVFDKVLIETIKEMDQNKQVCFVTRSQPILNDCLEEDVLKCGLEICADILSSGCKTPGTILNLCSPGFQEKFRNAEIIISKGQGNYEGLAEREDDRIFHLFNVKCSIMAADLNAEIDDMILIKNNK